MNILICGDSNYFSSIKFSLKQIESFSSAYHVFIYDWGFTVPERQYLEAIDIVTVTSWNRGERIDNVFNLRRIFTTFSKHVKWGTLNLDFFRVVVKFVLGYPGDYWEKENLMINKILCLHHLLDKVGGDILFLDADAFLYSDISNDSALTNCDLMVTLRPPHERAVGFNNCKLLNAGVFYLGRDQSKNQKVVKAWIGLVESNIEYLTEQSSLSRLLEIDLVENYGPKYLKGLDIRLKIMPCEEYNYNWMDDLENVRDVKIFHLKGGRHNTDIFTRSLQKLGLDY